MSSLLGKVSRKNLMDARIRLGRAIARGRSRRVQTIYLDIADAEVLRDILAIAIKHLDELKKIGGGE